MVVGPVALSIASWRSEAVLTVTTVSPGPGGGNGLQLHAAFDLLITEKIITMESKEINGFMYFNIWFTIILNRDLHD